MNGNSFESMIKKYADELIKMSREKTLPDTPEETDAPRAEEETPPTEEIELFPFEDEKAEETESPGERAATADIPGIEATDFYEETAEEIIPDGEETAESSGYASFSARVFTGNNAYPVENAKVLVVKDGKLFTFLTTDRDGVTKKVKLPSYSEENSLTPDSDMQRLDYTGEVYATGFTPKKNLLISAVGGSDIVLDVQMTPLG